ncbi:hypothetical protein TTRE_0000540601 [Trichuris trichiura]|uniref:Uncharacterized protein n=1 Tax=Trichuris trichiura TaxID=36087 RepID=A0A077ZBA6_TRITR|nr:hypothetical protein TTRE_0000540601 [Trichuris trichiura]
MNDDDDVISLIVSAIHSLQRFQCSNKRSLVATIDDCPQLRPTNRPARPVHSHKIKRVRRCDHEGLKEIGPTGRRGGVVQRAVGRSALGNANLEKYARLNSKSRRNAAAPSSSVQKGSEQDTR